MKIKQNKLLQLGQIIKWEIRSVSEMSSMATMPDKRNLKTVDLMVKAIYPHFVEFTIMEEPYLTMTITNAELYQNGIYTNTDSVNPFAR